MLSMPVRISRPLIRVVTGRALCLPSVAGPSIQNRTFSKEHPFTSTFSESVPPLPSPPPPSLSLEELVESGNSVLDELGLISWWKPSSYFRMALEGIHMYADLPWWLTIVSATVVLRLALIAVPIMSQKLVAKQSMYKKELEEFRVRQDEARKEGNNLLQQQIFLEQRDFLRSKDIRYGRQLIVLAANGGVFATQFFAIKKMIQVNYPGFSTGGMSWFTDLTIADPYYMLPLASAVTMGIVSRVGIEMGQSSDMMNPVMRLGMTYGLPVVIFAVSSQFGSGLCVYWCASNMISLLYAVIFKLDPVRKFFNIPAVVVYPQKKEGNVWKQVMNNYKSRSQVSPSLTDLKSKDAERFRKAGRGKPLIK